MELTKTTLRRQLREQRQSLSDPAERSARIAHHVLASDQWRDALMVMIYLSMDEEVDTAPLVTAALAEGKRLCVPRIGDDGLMVAVRIATIDPSTMEEYRRGIVQPQAGEVISPEEIDLNLIPCVGVDRSGTRLGFGGGHYDRFMEQSDGVKMGVVFGCQVCDALPREDHDQPLTCWVTEDGLALPE